MCIVEVELYMDTVYCEVCSLAFTAWGSTLTIYTINIFIIQLLSSRVCYHQRYNKFFGLHSENSKKIKNISY